MSTQQGSSSPYTGYQVPNYQPGSQYYGGNTVQQPNNSAWGGPQLRAGGIDVQQNMQWAGQNMPNAPYWAQTQAAGYYGAPFSSNPMEYGRWNWASPMGQQQQQPQQPQSPYVPPQTQPQQPTQTQPGTTQPTQPGQLPDTPQNRPPVAQGASNWNTPQGSRNYWNAIAQTAQTADGSQLPNWLTGTPILSRGTSLSRNGQH